MQEEKKGGGRDNDDFGWGGTELEGWGTAMGQHPRGIG